MLIDEDCTTVTEVAGDSTIDTEVNGELLIFTVTVDQSFTVTLVLSDCKTLTEFSDTTPLHLLPSFLLVSDVGTVIIGFNNL